MSKQAPDAQLPKLIAFDLDYTLWDLWIDTHVTAPLRRAPDGSVVDRYGTRIDFYADVPGLLRRLRAAGVLVAACSRTDTPDLARQALALLRVPATDDEGQGTEQPASALFDDLQIYPGSKIAHFRALHETTGVPYEQMLFFDDEPRNREVERLGVTFHLTPDGIDNAVFEAGVQAWKVRSGNSE
ncbi:magnesium-dependent phosphatase-1 [Mycena pura]|uniref:Magnesium-dependent phosphatase-1 n=1 Tax=Mycena pura TaxID=153505 RepID=A0AAD7E457_9AGAR|nr:magnesium-dependent phosphatase-1 [Mycena pura]